MSSSYTAQPEFDLFGDMSHARRNYIKQVQRTVETYDIDLKVVLELIQNAIDAVARNGTDRIFVDIDLPARRVTVTDTGAGFPPSQELLYLGGTDKDQDPDQKGKIGVGLKAVLFSSKRFHIHSMGSHGTWDLTVDDADEALERAEGDPETALLVQQQLDRTPPTSFGTTVTVDFRGREVHDWLRSAFEAVFTVEELGNAEDDAANLLYEFGQPYSTKADAFLQLYFRTAPYTADVKRFLRNDSPTVLTLSLKVGNSTEEFRDDPKLEELFKSTEYKTDINCLYADFESLLRLVPRNRVRFSLMDLPIPPGGAVGTSLPDRVWVQKLTNRAGFESLIKNRNGAVAEGHEIALSKINAIYLVMAEPITLRRFIPGGAKRLISSNGIITAHAFTTPRGARHELYVPRIHMIVDVDADLNYGKRHLNDRRLVNHLQRFFSEAYSRTLFEATRGLSATLRRTRDATDRSYVGLPDLELENLGFKKIPVVEQDVIALFGALLGKGLLPGYTLYGLSQVEQYDGRFYARRARSSSDPAFTTDDNLYKIEFKHRISSLCSDFENDEKDPRDIGLAVVWECDDTDSNWSVIDVSASRTTSDGSNFPHITSVLWHSSESHEVQVIELQKLIHDLAASDT